MRILIRALDRLISRATRVFEFCDAPECILRAQWGRAPHDVRLTDGYHVHTGELVLYFHLWNERLPRMGTDGANWAWAMEMRHKLFASLGYLGQWLAHQPQVADVRAVAATTAIVAPGDERGGALLRRMGFAILPARTPLGRFGDFWENLYASWLMWAYNAPSLRGRHLLRQGRVELWMPTDKFLQRYARGSGAGSP